jgi:hypothetical protein
MTKFNPFREDERRYNLMKSMAEEQLMRDLESGKVKAGSEEWRKQCEVIEYFDSVASDLNAKYNDND